MFRKKIRKCPFFKECEEKVSKVDFNNHCARKMGISLISQLSFEYCFTYKKMKVKKTKRKIPREWIK